MFGRFLWLWKRFHLLPPWPSKSHLNEKLLHSVGSSVQGKSVAPPASPLPTACSCSPILACKGKMFPPKSNQEEEKKVERMFPRSPANSPNQYCIFLAKILHFFKDISENYRKALSPCPSHKSAAPAESCRIVLPCDFANAVTRMSISLNKICVQVKGVIFHEQLERISFGCMFAAFSCSTAVS